MEPAPGNIRPALSLPARSLAMTAWLRSLRPGTLLLSSAAIAQGSALALWRGAFDPVTAALALLTATLLQILCNLAND
jgi:1,4-dihydroxy-2-naphthoate octaprenyltransferase